MSLNIFVQDAPEGQYVNVTHSNFIRMMEELGVNAPTTDYVGDLDPADVAEKISRWMVDVAISGLPADAYYLGRFGALLDVCVTAMCAGRKVVWA